MMEHTASLNRLSTEPFIPYLTTSRLFGQEPLFTPTLAQQRLLIQQLDYWRSLGRDRFKELTALNMTTHQQPVYQIG